MKRQIRSMRLIKAGVLLAFALFIVAAIKPAHAAFVPSGSIVLCHDAGKKVTWNSIAVDSETAATNTASKFSSTSINYQVRTNLGASPSCSSTSSWSGWSNVSSVRTKTAEALPASIASSRFIQIRFNLNTTNSANSPLLNSATVTDTPAGDTTDPTVAVSAPTSGAVMTGTTTLSATATDNSGGSGVSNVQFKVDGNNIGSPVSSTNTSFSTMWDTTTVPSGTHTVSAVATDRAGNVSSASTASAIVVNVTAAMTAPSDSDRVSARVTLGATTTNGGGNSTKVDFKVDDKVVAVDSTAPGPWEGTWDTRGYSNGSHTLQAVARVGTVVVGKSPVITVTVRN